MEGKFGMADLSGIPLESVLQEWVAKSINISNCSAQTLSLYTMKKNLVFAISIIIVAIALLMALLFHFGKASPARLVLDKLVILDEFSKSPRAEAIIRKKWPAGIDTSVEWHHGKYQIVMDYLIEFEEGHLNKSHELQSEIEKWYRDGDLVFLLSKETFGILNVQELCYTNFPTTNIVDNYQPNFDILIQGVDPRIRKIQTR